MDEQAVIQAIIRAVEEKPVGIARPRVPVITISRTIGSGGDDIAEQVADRLGVELYGAEILDAIAHGANVSKTLIQNLNEKMDATDAWVYSALFGKHVSRDEYVRFLITVVRGLYHAGGVIMGRGGHVILQGRKALRVRIVGSVEACAGRIAEQDGTSYIDAKRKVIESKTPSARSSRATSGAASSSGTCSNRATTTRPTTIWSSTPTSSAISATPSRSFFSPCRHSTSTSARTGPPQPKHRWADSLPFSGL